MIIEKLHFDKSRTRTRKVKGKEIMQRRLSTVDAFIGGEHLATLLKLRRENTLLKLLALTLVAGFVAFFLFSIR